MIKIRKCANGYITEVGSPSDESVHTTLESALARALQHFEGRCESFTGDAYGKVVIERKKFGSANE